MGVVIVDTIPEGTEYVPGSLVLDNIPQGTLPPEIQIGDIAPGSSETINFEVTVNDDAPAGTITNIAVISAEAVPEFTRAVSNTVTVNPVLDNIKTVKKVSSTSPVARGATLKYTIEVHNTGTAKAMGVVIVDTIPQGTTYVGGSLKVNNVDKVAGVLPPEILIGEILPGQSGTVNFDVKVDGDAPAGTITNIANISADGVGEFNRSVSNTVTAPSGGTDFDNIRTTKKVSSTNPVRRGDVLKYTIAVNNSGAAEATGITVAETIAPGTTYVPGSLLVDAKNQFAGELPQTIDMPDLLPGKTATIVFEVRVDDDALAGTVINTANISASGIDFSRAVSNSVSVNPVLDNTKTETKASTQSPVRRGDTIQYTISVNNDGTAAAGMVTVTNTIPEGTSYVPGTLLINTKNQYGSWLPVPIKVPDILVGKTATIAFKVKVHDNTTARTLTNEAKIVADGLAPFSRSVSNSLSATLSPTDLGTVEGSVTLQLQTDHSGTTITFEGPEVKRVVTSHDGGFSVTLKAGSYMVRAEHPYHLPAKTIIDLEEGETLRMEAVLLCCDLDQGGRIDLRDLSQLGQNFNLSESQWR